MSPRVLVVDDHPLVATGLQIALRARGWTVEVAAGPSPGAVIAQAEAFAPDCVLLDLHLGPELGSGVDLIGPLRALGAAVVMLTAETDRFALAACLEAGAEGWICKNAFLDTVVEAIDDVIAGRPLLGRTAREALLDELRSRRASLQDAQSPFDRLSPREQCVLGALVEGMSAEEIAETHYVSLATVRSQIRAILQKLGVRSQLAAVVHANRVGWKPAATVASAA
jgi:two-component system nitrate/nitrite response regulator NarL